jgi:D-alanyl-lipoteichoic acid acyltransferase DltB (MBOAT superfamily)
VYLGLSLFTNLGILGFFKYYGFFTDNLAFLGDQVGITASFPVSNFLLPVGISFYTFQTLSYTIDVYRREIEPERDLLRFALYVSFFPQLVAGPIERASRLLPQFQLLKSFDESRFWSGMRLIGWGLFKKMIIADRLALYVNAVYGDVSAYEG